MKVELKVVGGSRAGQVVPVTIPQFMIGRADDCHLKPRSELISRYHCTILSEEAYVAVRDLGSKNGVYVNGERVGVEQELKNGDRLTIGPLEFEVVLTVALKGETKSKVSSVSEAVARMVEQNSINAAAVRQAQARQATPESVQAVPKAEEAPKAEEKKPEAPVPVAPKVEEVKVETPVAEPNAEKATNASSKETATHTTLEKEAAANVSPFVVAPVAGSSSSSGDGDDDDLADWLLGDDEEESKEAQTLQMSLEDLDLPYTPKETEEAKPVEEPKKDAGPNSSDAAANLLKNFFKGGR